MKTLSTTFLFFLFVLTGISLAEEPFEVSRNISYDDDHAEAQRLDCYLAKSDKPVPVMIYIHGGGWRAGSKDRIPEFLARAVREGWLSVISVEYRFTDVAIHPAQVNDCARAIQFTRSKAKEWNIDPDKIGVCGGSAGGHLSLWLALHDDLANPESDDPIERESSRVTCAISFAGPTDWNLLSTLRHDHPAYRQLIGYEPGTSVDKMDVARMTDVSPVSFASQDDPPVLLVHGDGDVIVPVEHSRDLDRKLDQVGARSELFLVPGGNHSVAGAGGLQVMDRSTAFVREHLLGEKQTLIWKK